MNEEKQQKKLCRWELVLTLFARWCVLTDEADVFWKGARSELRLVTTGGTVKQEDQGQVCPSPVYLLHVNNNNYYIVLFHCSVEVSCARCWSEILLCNLRHTAWPALEAPRLVRPQAAAPDWLLGCWCLFLSSAAGLPQSHRLTPSRSGSWPTSCSGREPAGGERGTTKHITERASKHAHKPLIVHPEFKTKAENLPPPTKKIRQKEDRHGLHN